MTEVHVRHTAVDMAPLWDHISWKVHTDRRSLGVQDDHLEDLAGRLAAAEGEHRVPETAARLLHCSIVLEARLFESAVCVRRQHFCPLHQEGRMEGVTS